MVVPDDRSLQHAGSCPRRTAESGRGAMRRLRAFWLLRRDMSCLDAWAVSGRIGAIIAEANAEAERAERIARLQGES